MVSPKPGDVPELSHRFVTRRRCIGFKSDKYPIISESYDSDRNPFSMPPTVSSVIADPCCPRQCVLAKQFLFASIFPAYSPTCPHSDHTGND